MRRLPLAALTMVALALPACGASAPTGVPPPRPTDTPLAAPLAAALAAARERAALPAVAGLVVRVGGVEARLVLGLRRADQPASTASPDDRFHLGSNSKAITAALLARLVEHGVLRWETTLAEAFPELAPAMTPAYRGVTLRQLVDHRGGLPPFTTPPELLGAPALARSAAGATPAEARDDRRAFTAWLLARPTAAAPGTFVYSNAGYAVAAAVAERATGADWETLLRERLLRPLGLPDASVALGWPALAGAHPWGHVDAGARWQPHDPRDGRLLAIPAALAPAGDLSMTLDAYARVLQLLLRGLAGQDDLLRAAAVRALTTPDGAYGGGWVAATAHGAPAFAHEGSAGTFHAVTILVPSRGVGAVVIVNAGGERAAAAAREAALRALAP